MQVEPFRRVAVITGASSGIGKAAALGLAKQGWRIIGIGRDPERCAAAEMELRRSAPAGVPIEMIRGDLALMRDVERLAAEVLARTNAVDVLINNAGGVVKAPTLTSEGIEASFAGNHLGHFLLTRRLHPALQTSVARSQPGATRILAVSSSGHETVPGIEWDDMRSVRDYAPGRAYSRAKLANILFTRGLARRLAADGIVAHAMHPGVVDSNFINHVDAAMQRYMQTLQDVAVPPEKAAQTLLWLATSAEAGQRSGLYYHRCAAVPTSAAAQDDAAVERLWHHSERLLAELGFKL